MTYAFFLEIFRGFHNDVIICQCYQFPSLFFHIWPCNYSIGKNDKYQLLENFTRILKLIFNCFINLNFRHLWRHNDFMVCQCTHLQAFFQKSVLLIIVLVKMALLPFRKYYEDSENETEILPEFDFHEFMTS